MNFLLFIFTFLSTSFLPGINMTLALSLAMDIGYKRTMFMIIGGVLGLGFVSLACCLGASVIIINHPNLFYILKTIGGIYILYLSYQMFVKNSKFKTSTHSDSLSNFKLFLKGFFICNINPKAWIFIGTLLPPFLDRGNPVNLKMFILIFIIMAIEFLSYNVYALGGSAFKKLMSNSVHIVQKISAILMCIIGIWIVLN